MRYSVFFFYFIFLLIFPRTIFAVTDPLIVRNNPVGLHLLFPSELHQAADIINDSGRGAWGYVTIPIQSTDRDPLKWQKFFDDCATEKVIPLLRIATIADGSNWIQPNNFDLLDFANFLNDLRWPTQNRYIIFFNEVNRPDEYGGQVSPENYADILNNAINIFKSRSSDFFILPAGLDNAAISRNGAIYWKTYLLRMVRHQPEIFNKVDGWTSHAYPNPDFSARPDQTGYNKINSFVYDLQFIKNYTSKKLPVFITETGWSGKFLSDQQIAYYYQYAFSKVWNHPQVVAVTPFLLNAQDGPFKNFSFLDTDKKPKIYAQVLSKFARIGEPLPPIPPIIVESHAVLPATNPAISEDDTLTSLQKLYNHLRITIGF